MCFVGLRFPHACADDISLFEEIETEDGKKYLYNAMTGERKWLAEKGDTLMRANPLFLAGMEIEGPIKKEKRESNWALSDVYLPTTGSPRKDTKMATQEWKRKHKVQHYIKLCGYVHQNTGMRFSAF